MQFAIGVQRAHLVDIVGQDGRQVLFLPQTADAGVEFGGLRRIAVAERIDACACVRIDVPVRLVFFVQVAQQLDDDGVLEHVRVVACVKTVTITEHGGLPETNVNRWKFVDRALPVGQAVAMRSRIVRDWPCPDALRIGSRITA